MIFVNGVFDNEAAAEANLKKFQRATEPALSGVRNLGYDLAWVEGSWAPIQLVEAMAQRGIDDFQRYWLWLYGLEKAPDWFEGEFRALVTDPKILSATVLPELHNHLELYSNAILEGYQVIIVSHSQGCFYANAALRALPGYTPASLQPSIDERHRQNPDYPEAQHLVANIQIAAPVSQTVDGSPWVSFKDDQVVGWIGKVLRVLPGNIDSPGASADDLRAHGLDAYLRVDESRTRIIQDLRDAVAKLRYPIPYFQDAATVEYPSLVHGQSRPGFSASFFAGPHDITQVDEATIGGGDRMTRFTAECRDLRPGEVDIRAESIVQAPGEKEFVSTGYVGASGSGDKTVLRMINHREISRWRLGSVRVSPGQEKDPLEVDVKYINPVDLAR